VSPDLGRLDDRPAADRSGPAVTASLQPVENQIEPDVELVGVRITGLQGMADIISVRCGNSSRGFGKGCST